MTRWLLPLVLVLFASSASAGVFKPRGQSKKPAVTAKKTGPTAKKTTPTKKVVTTKPAKKTSSRVAEKGRPDDLTPDNPKKGKKSKGGGDEVEVMDDDEDGDVIVRDDLD